MKRFIIRLAVFAAIAVALDFSVGVAFSKIREMNRGGDVYRLAQIMDSMQDDVIIMGSSRAVHHYDPFIIEDSLGMSCQNCGFDGNGIIMQYALWKEITKRYYPKVLIYDIETSFDLSTEFDNHRYLSRLKPFYSSNPSIDSVFWEVDGKERIKMLAKTYQFNSNCMDVLAGWIHPLYADEGKGYKPLEGQMDASPLNIDSLRNIEYDSLKLSYFKKMISEANGKTKIIFVVSPYFPGGVAADYKPLVEICKENDVRFIDYSSNMKYVGKAPLFVDNYHLSREGSAIFTRDIVKVIKP